MSTREPVIIGGIARRSVTEVVDLFGSNKAYLTGWAASCVYRGRDFESDREDAAQLGTDVHKWIARHFRGEAQPEGVDPFDTQTHDNVRALFKAWQVWAFARDIEMVEIEKKMILEEMCAHGTPDAKGVETIGTFQGRWIYDWKTSSKGNARLEHWIQLAGYLLMCLALGEKIDGVCIVTIDKKKMRAREERKTVEEMAPFCAIYKNLHALSLTLDAHAIKVGKTESDGE